MKRHLVLAGKAVGGAGLTGFVLYLVAAVPANVHVYWPYWVFLAAVLAGVGLYFVGQDRSLASAKAAATPLSARHDAGPAVTDRWQLTIDEVSGEMLSLQNNSISHPGYIRRSPADNSPPSVRIGVKVASAHLDARAPTSDLRAKFLRFLGQPAVMGLLRELTIVSADVTWTARDDNPPFNLGAVLTQSGTKESPTAWARILLPESLTRQYGRDSRCAYLVVYVEPRTASGTPTPAASLIGWYERMTLALNLPTALAAFLADDLGLPTASDPAAEVGVWLKAPHALTELAEVDAFDVVDGSPQSNWFTGFAVSSPDGEPAPQMALAWLRQMCDSSLHLNNYESALASLAPQPADGRRVAVRLLHDEWQTWRNDDYIVALEVEVANATSNAIRIASIGLDSDWNGQPPGDLPVLGAADRHALDTEVSALRESRYAPELPAYQDVPPHGSISGWRVTTMARPLIGATPRLTLSVGEAVGRRYQLVIPRMDPQRLPWSDPRVVAAMANKDQLKEDLGFVPLHYFYSGDTFPGLIPWLVDHGTQVQFLDEEEPHEPFTSTRTDIQTAQGILTVTTYHGGATLTFYESTRTRATAGLNAEEAAEAANALSDRNPGESPQRTTVNCGINTQTRSVPGTLTVIRDRDGAKIEVSDGTHKRSTASLNTEKAIQAARALNGSQIE